MRRRRGGVAVVLIVLLAGGGAALRIATAANSGVRTIALGAQPWSVAVDPATANALVVNRGTGRYGFGGEAGSVSVVNTGSGKVLQTVSVGPDPRSVSVDQSLGRAFVANDDNGSVSVLDTHSGASLGTISVGSRPHAIAIDPQTHRAFVYNVGDDTISVVDTQRRVVLRTLHLSTDEGQTAGSAGAFGGFSGAPGPGGGGGGGPVYNSYSFGFGQGSALLDAHTKRVFLALGGTVRVLDPRTGALLHTTTVPGGGSSLAIDERTGLVYMAGADGVSVLDGQSGRVRRVVAVGGPASAVAVDERRGLLLATRTGGRDSNGTPLGVGSVAVVDLRTDAIVRSVDVGVAPVSVAVDPRGGRAVVINAGGPVHTHSAWSWVPPSLQQWVPASARPSAGTHTDSGSLSVVDLGS